MVMILVFRLTAWILGASAMSWGVSIVRRCRPASMFTIEVRAKLIAVQTLATYPDRAALLGLRTPIAA